MRVFIVVGWLFLRTLDERINFGRWDYIQSQAHQMCARRRQSDAAT